jgi:cell wall-associated NlpC family hydrolase
MNSIGRGGVVVAMSSGLVATMGLPAQAAPEQAAGPEPASPAAAPAAAPVGAAFQTALLSAPSSLSSPAAVTAPAAAQVTFETGAFKALPKPKAKPVKQAASGVGSSSSASVVAPGKVSGSAILAVAARYVGVSYRYGGTTPGGGWDCSGSTQYIFAQLGVDLPRTAQQQMLASKRVSRSEARAGDLVFFINGGRATHMGIVAGDGMMYDAGRTGRTYSKREIYSSSVVYGRVL